MGLRNEMELYTKLSGNDGEHTSIGIIGAYLSGFEKGVATSGKWIKITTRLLTEEERIKFSEHYGIDYEDTADEFTFDCVMPEDGQEILITVPWGVDKDVCEYDQEEGIGLYSLEGRGDWDGVTAWMPMPEPYKGGVD